MKKRLLSLFLALCLVLVMLPQAMAAQGPTEAEVYQAMMAMKEDYPEGMHWTNDNYYKWNGYSWETGCYYSGGYGCVAFSMILSDAAFGTLPACFVYDVTIENVRVGDILRINNDTHSVIILEVHDDHVIIAEGNFNRSIHWGRKLTASQVAQSDYMLTRYPDITCVTPPNSFEDVKIGSFYEDAVQWAVDMGITTGTSETTFSPDNDCLRAQVVTFLWRAAGEPTPTSSHNPFVDVAPADYYYSAVLWAVENGITNGADATHFNPNGVCNRAQVVTFLYRAFGNPAVVATENPFTDVPAGAFYAAPVLWAVENGITNGLSATEFGPNTDCNRAQIVTFLYRAYN